MRRRRPSVIPRADAIVDNLAAKKDRNRIVAVLSFRRIVCRLNIFAFDPWNSSDFRNQSRHTDRILLDGNSFALGRHFHGNRRIRNICLYFDFGVSLRRQMRLRRAESALGVCCRSEEAQKSSGNKVCEMHKFFCHDNTSPGLVPRPPSPSERRGLRSSCTKTWCGKLRSREN